MPDLTMRSIRDLGMTSPEVQEARLWILSMTPEADGEDGTSFWHWIEENSTIAGPESVYNTFLFIDQQTQSVVATASIVRDDRGVGAKFEMAGAWLGGVNVKRDARGQRIGSQVSKMVHEWIQKQARDRHEDIRVNLFTGNQIAMRMYEYLGFQRVGIFNVSATTATIYFRIYEWKTREKSEILKFISDLNTRALTYHNHKEASAWAALALYYLMMFAWIVPLALHEPLLNSRSMRWIGVVLLSIVTIGVAYYIQNQLNLRSYFGDVTGACYKLSAQCLGMDDSQINKLDLSGGTGDHRDRAIPQFITREITAVANVPHQERRALDFAQRALFWIGAGVVAMIMLFGRDFAEMPSSALKEGIASVVDEIKHAGDNIAGINEAVDKVRSELVSIADVKVNIARVEREITGLSRSVAETPAVPLKDIIADLAAVKADIAALKQRSASQSRNNQTRSRGTP